MSETMGKAKKKVYVETTVISDATALPSKDLVLAGRQFISREICTPQMLQEGDEP